MKVVAALPHLMVMSSEKTGLYQQLLHDEGIFAFTWMLGVDQRHLLQGRPFAPSCMGVMAMLWGSIYQFFILCSKICHTPVRRGV